MHAHTHRHTHAHTYTRTPACTRPSPLPRKLICYRCNTQSNPKVTSWRKRIITIHETRNMMKNRRSCMNPGYDKSTEPFPEKEWSSYCDVSSSPDLMWSEQGKSRWLHTRGGQQSSFNFATTSACLFKLTCIGTCRHCRVLTVQLKRITPLQNKGALTMITLASTFLQFQRTPFSIALKWESQEVSFLTFFLAPVTSLRCYLRSGDLITTFISDKCWHT